MCWWVYLELVHWRIFRTSHSGHFRSRCGTRTRLPRTDLANTCISEFKQPRAMHILFLYTIPCHIRVRSKFFYSRTFRTFHSGRFPFRSDTCTRLPRTDLANTHVSTFKQPCTRSITNFILYTQFPSTRADTFACNYSVRWYFTLSIWAVFAVTHAFAYCAQSMQHLHA